MNTTYMIIAVVLILLIMGALMGPNFMRRKRSQRFRDEFGTEYDRMAEAMGSENAAQMELDNRRKHVETLNIRSLSPDEQERFMNAWNAVQAKFVDDPGQATTEADHLITELMRLRDYPVSDFEQRAADISVTYPALVSPYRAAQETALRHEHGQAGTEDLRKALISYRSLFDELLKSETGTSNKKITPEKTITPEETVAPEEKVAPEKR